MDLDTAKEKFMELSSKMHADILTQFISWIRDADQFQVKDSSEVVLENIAEDIRQIIPFDAVLPSEKIFKPVSGNNSELDEKATLHVDSFLYDDDYLDELVDQGKFSRNYCLDCSSRNTKPLTFISHSASMEMLKAVFWHVLPDLSNKIVVDIGSRFGTVLYSAYLFSSAKTIIGIEINQDLCKIQEQMISKYNMKDRVTVINDDVLNCSKIICEADVVVMHNVFEFFTDHSNLKQIWSFIIESIVSKGKLLVTCPSLEESLDPLGMSDVLDTWVEEIPLNSEGNGFVCEEDVHLYKTK